MVNAWLIARPVRLGLPLHDWGRMVVRLRRVAQRGLEPAFSPFTEESGHRNGYPACSPIRHEIATRATLLGQAEEWEYRALTELESYFMAGTVDYDIQPRVAPYAHARWETMAAA